jgi:hypothetical protein
MAHGKKGPSGPRRSAGGKKGTNKSTSHKGAGVSGMGHQSAMVNKSGRGFYGRGAR